MKKLTLNLEEEEIRLARELAREDGVSVSALFANLLRGRIALRRGKVEQEKLPPLTRKALGMARLPKGKTEQELMEEALAEKYGMPPLTRKLSGILRNPGNKGEMGTGRGRGS